MSDTLPSSEAAITALGALAQEHRLAAFRLLVEAGPRGLPAGDIAARLGVPASSLSFHLAHLERAELVAKTRMGRSLVYRARFDTVRGLAGYLLENCCGGASCAVDEDVPCQPKGAVA